MCKKHDAAGFKRTLQDVMQRGYMAIDSCYQELAKLKDKKSPEANSINIALAMLIDAIHPGNKMAIDLFPESNHPFIKGCIANHHRMREDKLVPSCHCCKPIEEKPNDQ